MDLDEALNWSTKAMRSLTGTDPVSIRHLTRFSFRCCWTKLSIEVNCDTMTILSPLPMTFSSSVNKARIWWGKNSSVTNWWYTCRLQFDITELKLHLVITCNQWKIQCLRFHCHLFYRNTVLPPLNGEWEVPRELRSQTSIWTSRGYYTWDCLWHTDHAS